MDHVDAAFDNAGKDRLVRKGLKLRHLRLISAVRDTGQVGAAAQRLSMAQPAASRLLADLEAIVGADLYVRHPRGIELTELGGRLAERARRILCELDDTDREIGEMSAGQRGRVSLGSVTGPALEVVLPVIRQMRVTHPAIDVMVTVETSGKLVEALLDGTIDFFIGRILGDADLDLFSTQVVGEEPIGLIVRNGHPLTRRKDLELEDCIPYDWVMQTKDGLLAQTVERYLVEAGNLLPQRVVRTSSLLMTLALIGQSNAIAPIARSVAEFYSDSNGFGGRITTLPVAEDLTVSAYSLIRMKDKDLSPAAQLFYSAVEQQLNRCQMASRLSREKSDVIS
ncbi:LysR family transcriptional regulator [Stappia sp. GBMRC 2046]|uniref:LysR family transcriptional regulator n=1 Tax=Stappia sediminis TaxID=2692190 RepID=A0A7X3LSE7_9HYPH|nr:LysR family transcriptional regulator [Stappia sediminis]MXN64221.1 LysR family transcriptional regulator [Stappia sediminis]